MSKNSMGKYEYNWHEWEMVNKDEESTIDISGQLFFDFIFLECYFFLLILDYLNYRPTSQY